MNTLLVNTNSNQPLTMSSREIADLTGKRHDSVMRTIESLSAKGLLECPQFVETQHEQNKQMYMMANLEKTDSLVLIARLSPEFTKAIVDRWQDLESKVAQPAPQLPDLSEAIDLLESEIEQKSSQVSTLKKAQYHRDQFMMLTNGATQITSKSQAQRERDHILAYVARRDPMTVDQLEQNVVRQQGNPFEIYTKRGEARSMIRHTIGDLCQIGYVKLSGDHIIPVCH